MARIRPARSPSFMGFASPALTCFTRPSHSFAVPMPNTVTWSSTMRPTMSRLSMATVFARSTVGWAT